MCGRIVYTHVQIIECIAVTTCFIDYTSANEQSVPSESYMQEVKEQLEETRKEHEEIQESQHQRETRSASDGTGKVWTVVSQ